MKRLRMRGSYRSVRRPVRRRAVAWIAFLCAVSFLAASALAQPKKPAGGKPAGSGAPKGPAGGPKAPAGSAKGGDGGEIEMGGDSGSGSGAVDPGEIDMGSDEPKPDLQ